MLIVDSHNHFWRYNPKEYDWITNNMQVLKRDFFPEQLKVEFDKTGVSYTVAVQARQTVEENDFLLDLADNSSGIVKGVVGWVNLQDPEVERDIERYAANKIFVGVRHIVQGEKDEKFMLREEFLNGVYLLKKYGLTYDILIHQQQLPLAVRFCEKFPDHKLVLDHIAKPLINQGDLEPWKSFIKEIARHPHLYCKVSGLVTEADWKNWKEDDFKPYLEVIFEEFGADRIMFGSDWPVCLLAGSYGKVQNLLQIYISQLSMVEQEKIMGLNTKYFYNLAI
jgi:L-fuconolactonase